MHNSFFRNFPISEQRINADPEIKEFVRAKRNYSNIPNSWDDIRQGRRGKETSRQKIQSKSNYRITIRLFNTSINLV